MQRAATDPDSEAALIKRMRGLLGPFVLRRLKSELADQLVTKTHKLHDVCVCLCGWCPCVRALCAVCGVSVPGAQHTDAATPACMHARCAARRTGADGAGAGVHVQGRGHESAPGGHGGAVGGGGRVQRHGGGPQRARAQPQPKVLQQRQGGLARAHPAVGQQEARAASAQGGRCVCARCAAAPARLWSDRAIG
jgi:hypothetical protein